MKILQEKMIRDKAKNIVQNVLEEEALKETLVRFKIRQILNEIEAGTSPTKSTAISILEDLLKKIIPIIEEDYKDLGSNREQRISFASHLLRAIENALEADALRHEAEDLYENIGVKILFRDEGENDLLDMLDIGDDGLIDIDDKSEDELEREKFAIPGLDETGRNMALRNFKKIESSIIEAFEILADDKDKDVFHSYLVKNIKLYLKNFEEDMNLGNDQAITK